MKRCLIGYTGFVGSTLLRQTAFDALYNRSNIADIRGQEYDLVVCAGAPAVKWYASQHADEDLANLQTLMGHLEHVRAGRMVLISTVDVYQQPAGVDEDTIVDPTTTDPYGRHRFYLEQFVRAHFSDSLIVRLPGLFGPGLKKNFIFDLLQNPGALHLTHCESKFQYYNMERLWLDLEKVMATGIPLVHFATEPVQAAEVARECFGKHFDNRTEKPPVNYDMHTKYAAAFGASGRYLYSRAQVLSEIRQLAARWSGGHGA